MSRPRIRIDNPKRHACLKLAEEMAELTQQLMKFSVESPKKKIEHLAEEMAHVELWVEIVKHLYFNDGGSMVKNERIKKLNTPYFNEVLRRIAPGLLQ